MSTAVDSDIPFAPTDASQAHAWIEEFRRRNGHAPRVLHVGNIANNAYNNAKLLNAAGLDCDVICYDYYHIMGCPEWEDADFSGDLRSDFYPAWERLDLKKFRRPRWFAQGRRNTCIRYLIARRTGNRFHAWYAWKRLSIERRLVSLAGRNNWLPLFAVVRESVRDTYLQVQKRRLELQLNALRLMRG